MNQENGFQSGVLPPALAAISIGIVGVIGMASGMPWLFPSLGPTLALQTAAPDLPGSRSFNVVVGHLIGLSAGFAAVHLTHAVDVLPVTDAHALSGPRIAAAVLAVFLSMIVQHLVKAKHPPAEATTLLIALGNLEPTMRTALTIISGVLIMALLGEISRRAAYKKT
ncbi:HPP family protein [Noviherbaspirillum massiliense]|uniref:HPP family protein n=1 Tax=Noviherbaspirillum massiliense TaxID=1465823 RepID=UPI0003656C70|nr:HPP family protein [Noviherbaspirillum massiliense]